MPIDRVFIKAYITCLGLGNPNNIELFYHILTIIPLNFILKIFFFFFFTYHNLYIYILYIIY